MLQNKLKRLRLEWRKNRNPKWKNLGNHPEHFDYKAVRKQEAQREYVITYFNEAASRATNATERKQCKRVQLSRKQAGMNIWLQNTASIQPRMDLLNVCVTYVHPPPPTNFIQTALPALVTSGADESRW